MAGTLQDSDVLAAVNGVTLNGKPLTTASFQSLLQYAALAFMRDYATAQAVAKQQQLGQQASDGQVTLASLQAQAATAQADIAALMDSLPFTP